MAYRDKFLGGGGQRQIALYNLVSELYQDEIIAQTNVKHNNKTTENLLEVFLHTHQIYTPIPITKFIKDVRWSESVSQDGSSGTLSLRMPFAIFQLLFKGEHLEPSTGHFITMRRQIPSENPHVGEIKRTAPPAYEGPTAAEIIQANRASFPIGIPSASDLAEAVQEETQLRESHIQAAQQQEDERIQRLERKRDQIFYQTFWVGVITNMEFSLAPNLGDGLTTMSDIRIQMGSWETMLKTTMYKIVNADIDRRQRTPEDDDATETEESSSQQAVTGARFIVTKDLFKQMIREIKGSISNAQDPKVGLTQILNIFGYHRIPRSLKMNNTHVRKMLEELEKIKQERKGDRGRLVRERSILGTGQEVTSDGTSILILMQKLGISALIDSNGRQYSLEEATQMTAAQFEQTFVLPAEDSVTVLGKTYLQLSEQVKVCTVKEDLPPSCGFLRHLLPDRVIHFKNLNRFVEIVQQQGTPWTRMLGSFVVDNNIIDFYPLVVPVTKDDIRSGWKPVGSTARTGGFQMCLIWRVKPLRPGEIINKEYYNEYVNYANKHLDAWRKMEQTTINFAHDKLPLDPDGEMSVSAMGIDNRYIEAVTFNYSEGGKTNGAYLEHPFMKSQNTLKFGTLSQPVIDTYSAQHYGFRMYEAQYPFLDATKDRVERDAMTEKVYCIMRDIGDGSRGAVVMRGIHTSPLKPGIWIAFGFDNVFNPAHGMDSVINDTRGTYFDKEIKGAAASLNFTPLFVCMVDAVVHHYTVDPIEGSLIKTTELAYSRGKFFGGPTLQPERHDFGRPENVIQALPPIIQNEDGSIFEAGDEVSEEEANQIIDDIIEENA